MKRTVIQEENYSTCTKDPAKLLDERKLELRFRGNLVLTGLETNLFNHLVRETLGVGALS